ncbi:hypothetical protein MNBD_BACTEROID03-1577 [hydrothermal vent metagenome]|uniref:Uncharacterized protein n=1 Tax=hydrothermal vent metagenome TaxID=652676 RepID=A0A3B0T2N1_9ZZZZ
MEKTGDRNDKLNQEYSPLEPSNNWLQRLKDESWEAELLVSAIAIFGTFQLFKVIDWSTNKFIDLLPSSQYVIGYLIAFMGLLAVSILVSMFVIHFFIRAYWVGLVGLNSVFPDYSIKDSAYSKIYTEKILAILPKLKDSIQKVDALCSVIFSAAFSILLMYGYLALFASAYLFLFNLLSDYVPYYFLLIPAAIIAIVYILQMIISIIANLKAFKENLTIQVWYFKIMKLTAILSLGPLYKNNMQISMIFGSNFKKNKALVYLILLFLFSGVFVAAFQISNTNILYLVSHEFYFDETKAYASYYKTENEDIGFLLTPEITSDLIQSNILKLFIPIFSHEKKMSRNTCGTYTKDESKSRTEQRKEKRVQYLNCYQKYNQV